MSGKRAAAVRLRGLSQPGEHPHLLHVDQHGKRRHLELVPVELLERLHHRGRQVGATAHRLADQHVGADLADQAFHGADHVGEAAAEAAAGHLLDLRAGLLENLGIHQVGRLVVGHQSHALALARQALGRLAKQRGLSGAQEPADENHSGCRHLIVSYGSVFSTLLEGSGRAGRTNRS